MIHRPSLWYLAFAAWFGILWWLSSGTPEFPPALDFRASDKLLHFGYFFGGAGLLSTALFLSHPGWTTRRRILATVALVGLVGALDEFHQSFVPLRSGNDPLDFAADLLGAIAGSLAFLPFRRSFRPPGRTLPPQLPSTAATRPFPKFAILGFIFGVFLVSALFFATVRNFRIPTSGMAPTLVPGDFVLCTRSFRDASGHGRGDVVVFRPPTQPDAFFIQRIAAVAGDRIELIDGHLHVNGEALISPEGLRSPVPEPAQLPPNLRHRLPRYPLVLPPGEIFVLGDNFHNSLDSRYFGPIPAGRITHVPHRIILPLSRQRKLGD